MPFNGSGTWYPPSLPGSFAPAITGQTATAADWNTLLADIAAGLSSVVTSDGQSIITGNIPFNNHKITGLANGTLPGDATSLSQVQALIAAAVSASAPTGIVLPFCGATAPSGWVLAWGTIGDASSGASNRANADCEALFTLLWNDWANAEAPVSGGRGANAAADWAAHKTIAVPDLRGRAPFGKDNMGGTAANRITVGVSGIAGTTLGAAGGDERLQQHTHGVNDPGHNHLTNAGNTGLGSGGGGNALWQSPSGAPVTSAVSTTNISIQNAGAGASQNMPPGMIFNMLVKL